MNTRATSVQFKDIDGDSVDEWVFKLSIDDIPYASATGKFSLPCFNIYVLTYDASFAIPAGGKPDDTTEISKTKVTEYIQWYAEVSATKKAIAVTKIVLVANTSDIAKISLSKVNIPGIGYLDGSNFDESVLSSEIRWTYTISSKLYGADYIKLPVNVLNKFEFTTQVDLTLGSSGTIGITLYIYQLDYTGSQVSDSDTVGFAAQA